MISINISIYIYIPSYIKFDTYIYVFKKQTLLSLYSYIHIRYIYIHTISYIFNHLAT